MKPIFTPRSARVVALSLRPVLLEAVRLYRALEPHAPRSAPGERPVDPAYFVGVRRLLRAMEQMRRAGAEVGDLRCGRLQFPARRQGADVVLRWELREPQALWYGGVPAEEDGGWEEPR